MFSCSRQKLVFKTIQSKYTKEQVHLKFTFNFGCGCAGVMHHIGSSVHHWLSRKHQHFTTIPHIRLCLALSATILTYFSHPIRLTEQQAATSFDIICSNISANTININCRTGLLGVGGRRVSYIKEESAQKRVHHQ